MEPRSRQPRSQVVLKIETKKLSHNNVFSKHNSQSKRKQEEREKASDSTPKEPEKPPEEYKRDVPTSHSSASQQDSKRHEATRSKRDEGESRDIKRENQSGETLDSKSANESPQNRRNDKEKSSYKSDKSSAKKHKRSSSSKEKKHSSTKVSNEKSSSQSQKKRQSSQSPSEDRHRKDSQCKDKKKPHADKDSRASRDRSPNESSKAHKSESSQKSKSYKESTKTRRKSPSSVEASPPPKKRYTVKEKAKDIESRESTAPSRKRTRTSSFSREPSPSGSNSSPSASPPSRRRAKSPSVSRETPEKDRKQKRSDKIRKHDSSKTDKGDNKRSSAPSAVKKKSQDESSGKTKSTKASSDSEDKETSKQEVSVSSKRDKPRSSRSETSQKKPASPPPSQKSSQRHSSPPQSSEDKHRSHRSEKNKEAEDHKKRSSRKRSRSGSRPTDTARNPPESKTSDRHRNRDSDRDHRHRSLKDSKDSRTSHPSGSSSNKKPSISSGDITASNEVSEKSSKERISSDKDDVSSETTNEHFIKSEVVSKEPNATTTAQFIPRGHSEIKGECVTSSTPPPEDVDQTSRGSRKVSSTNIESGKRILDDLLLNCDLISDTPFDECVSLKDETECPLESDIGVEEPLQLSGEIATDVDELAIGDDLDGPETGPWDIEEHQLLLREAAILKAGVERSSGIESTTSNLSESTPSKILSNETQEDKAATIEDQKVDIEPKTITETASRWAHCDVLQALQVPWHELAQVSRRLANQQKVYLEQGIVPVHSLVQHCGGVVSRRFAGPQLYSKSKEVLGEECTRHWKENLPACLQLNAISKIRRRSVLLTDYGEHSIALSARKDFEIRSFLNNYLAIE